MIDLSILKCIEFVQQMKKISVLIPDASVKVDILQETKETLELYREPRIVF